MNVMDRIFVDGIEYARVTPSAAAAEKRVPQPKMVECKCRWCRSPFMARAVDVKRGWGLFCSKSCKAMRQEKRTGQYTTYQDRRNDDGHYGGEFTNAHQFSNEEHDCNKD